MAGSLFPEDLRNEYDVRVLDVEQRSDKARQLRDALESARLWQSPKNILDVGCGSALLLNALAAPNSNKVGCDFRIEPFLRAGLDRSRVTFVQADADRLPFRKKAFDLVICLAVIEEIMDWRMAIQAMAECVSPGGVLYVTMTNGKTLSPFYSVLTKLGLRVETSWWHYAQSSLRFTAWSPADGFGIAALSGWRYVNVTPYLARASLPVMRALPLAVLSALVKYGASSFGHAWLKS